MREFEGRVEEMPGEPADGTCVGSFCDAEEPRPRRVRFGGPGLPAGTHTFYVTPGGLQVTALPGDVVDASMVTRLDEFLERGQAEVIED